MKILSKLRKQDSGFTLAEVLVAVIISALVIIPTLSTYLMGRVGTEVAKHRTQAMNIIRARLEYLESKGYNYVNQLPYEDMYQETELDENEEGEAIPCRVDTIVRDADGDDLLEVEVWVSWREKRMGNDDWVYESVMTFMAPTRVYE